MSTDQTATAGLLAMAAKTLGISAAQAEVTAAELLYLLAEENADGGAIVIRNKAAKTAGLLVSERALDLRKLVEKR